MAGIPLPNSWLEKNSWITYYFSFDDDIERAEILIRKGGKCIQLQTILKSGCF